MLRGTYQLEELKTVKYGWSRWVPCRDKTKRCGIKRLVILRVVFVCQWFHRETLITLMCGDVIACMRRNRLVIVCFLSVSQWAVYSRYNVFSTEVGIYGAKYFVTYYVPLSYTRYVGIPYAINHPSTNDHAKAIVVFFRSGHDWCQILVPVRFSHHALVALWCLG